MEDAQHRHANEPKIPSNAGGSGAQMNMRGVFLHVMADALGSVVVIISAVIMWKTEWEYKVYVDPGNLQQFFQMCGRKILKFPHCSLSNIGWQNPYQK